jgi:hypothetical protein
MICRRLIIKLLWRRDPPGSFKLNPMGRQLKPPAKLPLRIAPNGKSIGGYPILDADGNYIGRIIGKNTAHMILEKVNKLHYERISNTKGN